MIQCCCDATELYYPLPQPGLIYWRLKEPPFFDKRVDYNSDGVDSLLSPSYTVDFDPAFAGQWLVCADLDGDGFDEILLAHARTLCDAGGRVRYRLAPDDDFSEAAADPGQGDSGLFAVIGDMTGDSRVDIIVHTERRAQVYGNIGEALESDMTVGTSDNFTLY